MPVGDVSATSRTRFQRQSRIHYFKHFGLHGIELLEPEEIAVRLALC